MPCGNVVTSVVLLRERRVQIHAKERKRMVAWHDFGQLGFLSAWELPEEMLTHTVLYYIIYIYYIILYYRLYIYIQLHASNTVRQWKLIPGSLIFHRDLGRAMVAKACHICSNIYILYIYIYLWLFMYLFIYFCMCPVSKVFTHI